MGKKLYSKVREPTRQWFISHGEAVGLLLGGEEDFEDEDFKGEDQEGLGLADSIWADNSQLRMIAAKAAYNLVTLHGNAWLMFSAIIVVNTGIFQRIADSEQMLHVNRNIMNRIHGIMGIMNAMMGKCTMMGNSTMIEGRISNWQSKRKFNSGFESGVWID